MNDMTDNPVRDLLGAAVGTAESGAHGGTEELFAAASRVRRRRRAGVIGGAAALAAGATLLAPQLSGGAAAPRQTTTTVASSGRQAAPDRAVAHLRKQLPGVGRIERTLLDFGAPGKNEIIKPEQGALEGIFSVSKGGRTGYFSIDLREYGVEPGKDPKFNSPDYNACETGGTADCSYERLSDGSLTIYRLDDGTLVAQRRLSGRGDVLINDSRGNRAALGPEMAAPPLSRDQLRKIALDPEELAKP
ncbi:hypothetical protein [Peterkaempfera griseoplana]|uniref:hypothetical protein n=1 Tax=Peterkaempfera griseoplana TaxID=66896 RepID=UPI0006E140A5|nr:hypothetical protein [Peterkaempfera griseoplana]